jgi:hypothetical protein
MTPRPTTSDNGEKEVTRKSAFDRRTEGETAVHTGKAMFLFQLKVRLRFVAVSGKAASPKRLKGQSFYCLLARWEAAKLTGSEQK